MSILGVIMAGGRNTRFGNIKAFAEVNGERIIDRVIGVLSRVSDEVVISANDAETYAVLGLPMRADIHRDLGALGGIHTALAWARELEHDGILAVACDMPFASASLLRAILAAAPGHDAVLPESDGRRGIEPLFAYYSVRCLPAVAAAIDRGDRRMIGFHEDVRVQHLPIAEVRKHGDPELLFMNVNTLAELEIAQQRAAGCSL